MPLVRALPQMVTTGGARTRGLAQSHLYWTDGEAEPRLTSGGKADRSRS